MESINTHAGMMAPEIKLIYINPKKASELPIINTSKSAYETLLASWDKDTIELIEQFKVMLLNRGNRLIGICSLSKGGITNTVADPRLVFASALISGSTSIIVAHNHPSGCLSPSKADELLTNRLSQGGLLLDIRVTDHIILCTEGYYSFSDEGLL